MALCVWVTQDVVATLEEKRKVKSAAYYQAKKAVLVRLAPWVEVFLACH